MGSADDYYFSAVCKRGHTIDSLLSSPDDRDVSPFCGSCGAPVITRCEKCNAPLRGRSRHGYSMKWQPAPFCRQCGSPHRWASREQRITYLQNLLEFEDLDEAAQLAVIEQLAVLATPVDEVDEDQQAEAGDRLRKLAPKLWEAGLPIIQTVLSDTVKQRLGLP